MVEPDERLTPDDLVTVDQFLRRQRHDLLTGIMRLEAEQAADSGADPIALRVMRGELDRTERALQRLARGAYGTCEDCGAPIDRRRLSILPSAAHCTTCSAKLKAVRPQH